MLISWEVWKEPNARVFLETSSNANMIIARIMDESNARCLTGVKFLSNVILGEKANYKVIGLVLDFFSSETIFFINENRKSFALLKKEVYE
jgi:hypothetical protein